MYRVHLNLKMFADKIEFYKHSSYLVQYINKITETISQNKNLKFILSTNI